MLFTECALRYINIYRKNNYLIIFYNSLRVSLNHNKLRFKFRGRHLFKIITYNKTRR